MCYSQISLVPTEVGMYTPVDRTPLPMGAELAHALRERLKELDALLHIRDGIKAQNELNDKHKVCFTLGEPNGYGFAVPQNRAPRHEVRWR